MVNPSQSKQPSAIPVSEPVKLTTLSSSVQIDIPEEASAVLVQVEGQIIHFRIGAGRNTSIIATTDDFWLSNNLNTPVIIPVPPGGRIAFVESSASAQVIYQFLR